MKTFNNQQQFQLSHKYPLKINKNDKNFPKTCKSKRIIIQFIEQKKIINVIQIQKMLPIDYNKKIQIRLKCSIYSTLVLQIKMKSGKNQKVDYILLNLMPHTSSKPSFEEAVEHRKLYSAVRHTNQIRFKDGLTFNTEVFKRYGSGVYLYFSLIKILFYTFVILTLNSLPIFLSNFKGDGLHMYGQNNLAKTLMRFSLGNQRHQQYQKVLTNESVRIDLFASQTLIVIVDIINSLIFFVFLIYWKLKSDNIVAELISEHALPSYYTLEVHNLPDTYTQQSLKTHFEKFGADIAQISTVYNYESVLTEIKKLIKQVDDYASSGHQNRLLHYQKIQKQYQKVRNLTKFKVPKPVISFVTIEDLVMRKKLKDLYLYGLFPEQLRYEGKLLKVTSCKVEPSSIIWQNYHLKPKTQIRQSILISILLIFVLILALLALFLANTHATSMMEKKFNFSTKFDYNKQYSFKEAKQQGSLEAIFIFCSKLTYHYFEVDFYSFCQPYFDSYKQRFGLMIGLSLLVVTINIILNYIICELANFRRYKTKTQKNRFLVLNIFSLYFINSGLLMLLIRVKFAGYSLGRLVSSFISLPFEQFSIESYSDFNRKWYINIGSQILMIYAVSLFISPFIQILLNWLQAKYRYFKAKRAKTQFKMNQTLIDSEFDFQTFYAMILNSCFFTLFHGNAIPLLYLLAIGAFFSLYIASFIVFKEFSCKPVMFDHTLNSVISRVLCIALIMHQLTSMMYFYTEDIFPLDIWHHKREKTKELHEDIGQILLHKLHQSIPFLVLSIVFIICTFNYSAVCKVVKKYIYKHFTSYQLSKKPKTFSQIFLKKDINNQSRNPQYLCSYKMEDNPNYLNISYALQILSIFEPYFISNSTISIPSIGQIEPITEEIKNNIITQQSSGQYELQDMEPKSNRPFILKVEKD